MTDYGNEFCTMVLRGLRASLLQLQRPDVGRLSEHLRRRAWTALDYGLTFPEAWPLTLELLLCLAPKMEVAGPRYEWLGYLLKGWHYSQRTESDSAAGRLGAEIGLMQQLLGDLPAARHSLEAACAWLQRTGEPAHLATALDRLAEVARLQRHFDECQRLVDELLALVPPDSTNAAFGYFLLGKVAFDQLQWDTAAAHFQRALAIWVSSDPRHQALCIQNLGRVAWRKANFTAAVAYFQEALSLLKEQGDLANSALVEMNLGNVYWAQGDLRRALQLYQSALTVFRAVGHMLHLAMAYNNCGLAYMGLDDWKAAEDHYRTSLGLWIELGDERSRLEPEIGLAIAYTQQRRLTEALALFTATAQRLALVDPTHGEQYLWQELEKHWARARQLAAETDG